MKSLSRNTANVESDSFHSGSNTTKIFPHGRLLFLFFSFLSQRAAKPFRRENFKYKSRFTLIQMSSAQCTEGYTGIQYVLRRSAILYCTVTNCFVALKSRVGNVYAKRLPVYIYD